LVSPIKVSLDKEGYPLLFKDLKEFLGGSLEERKFVFTLLMISRTLQAKKNEQIPVKLNSITDPKIGNLSFLKEPILDYVIFKELNLTNILPLPWSTADLSVVTKGGPNGPALLTYIKTLKRFGYSELVGIAGIASDDCLKWFKSLYLHATTQNVFEEEEFKTSPRSTKFTRRLSVIKDPECKMRVIAMFDYVSQTCLEPLSNKLFSILKQIPSDRTFTQNPYLHKPIDANHRLWSLDLTAATDRFPLTLQIQILSKLTNPKFAESWALLMSGSPFASPLDPTESINYSVGQPMGAKSSWPMFTLSHHIVVRYCAVLCGVTNFENYMILGDDIVINNDQIALKYIQVMNDLGVEISKSKTHTSFFVYEFAKRWIDTRIGECTGIPMKGLIENIDNIFIIYQILFDYYFIKGNLYMAKSNLVWVVASLIRAVLRSKQKQCFSQRSFVERLEPLAFFMRYRFGYVTYDEARCFFAKHLRSDIYMIPTKDVVRDEISRVMSLAMVGTAWSSARVMSRFIPNLFSNPFFLDRSLTIDEDGTPIPMLQAVYNYTDKLVMKMTHLQLSKITVEEAMEDVVLLDVEAMMSFERCTKVQMLSHAALAARFRAELRFDPLQLPNKYRALTAIKHTRDIRHALYLKLKALKQTGAGIQRKTEA
jgi:hypothetical protein